MIPSSNDKRDETTWVVLELTRAGEQQVESGALEGLLREALKLEEDHPIFIPSTIYNRNGRTVSVHLMVGYTFVASGQPEATFFDLERDSPYVRKVLVSKNKGMPVLAVLPNQNILEMQQQLREAVASDLVEGIHVLVTQGAFTQMTGEIIDVDGDEASVLFTMRSFRIIRNIPKIFLEPADEDVVL